MAENALHTIEETLAHHEQQITDLSDMVVRQSDEISVLKKYIVKLEDKIGAIEDDGNIPSGESLSVTDIATRDKPPHY